MGHFKIISKVKLAELPLDTRIEESDFASLTDDGTFVQLKYHEDQDKIEEYHVKPGMFTIIKTMQGLELQKSSFVSDKLLDSFIHTENIVSKIDSFFKRTHIYAKYGIEVPKRAMLLYGPAGTGKTSSIIKSTDKYKEDNETLIILWPTDKFEAHEVKDLIKSFEYNKHNVKRVILVVEDIGGVEMDQVRMKSDSSLLSLLDNQEKTFKIPIFIIATTNHPEIFLGNLTNRPGRFNDKVEVGLPSKEFKTALFKFFAKELATEEAVKLFESNKCKEFTADHIREAVIRSDLYEIPFEMVVDQISKEIDEYKKAFEKKASMGIGMSSRYDD